MQVQVREEPGHRAGGGVEGAVGAVPHRRDRAVQRLQPGGECYTCHVRIGPALFAAAENQSCLDSSAPRSSL